MAAEAMPQITADTCGAIALSKCGRMRGRVLAWRVAIKVHLWSKTLALLHAPTT
jgi:hypothetical protein